MAATLSSTPHARTQHTRRRSSNSASTPLEKSSPLTMADTLPSVDFGFEALKTRMTQFTARFDEFIEKGRRRVLEERNGFKAGVAELEETQSSHLKALTHIQGLLSSHQATLQAHASEKRDLLSTIGDISTRQTTVLSQRDRLKAQIAETQRQIDARVKTQDDYARKIEGLVRLNEPELNFWESHLGCRIEGGGGVDMLRVVYWLISPNGNAQDAGRGNDKGQAGEGGAEAEQEGEAYFDLSTASRDYAITITKPRLDKEKVGDVVEKLNANRDFGAFLRGMRALFVEAMRR